MGRPKQSKEQLKLSGMDKAHPGRYESMANTPDAILMSKLTCPVKYRPETKRAWNRMVPMFISRGFLSDEDVDQINSLFKLFNSYIVAYEHLEKVIDNEESYEDEFQFLGAFERWNNQALKTLDAWNRMAAKYGVSPAERAKLTLPEKKKESPIEQMLRKAAQ